MITLKGKYTTAKVMIDEIDDGCRDQIITMTNHEAFTNAMVIMPDTHLGTGSVIGFTMPISNKIIPNVIGVDIGCGMLSFNIGKININHEDLDQKIREKIPFGFNINKKGKVRLDQDVMWLCKKIGVDFDYVVRSIGSLGGGKLVASRP